MTTWVVPVFRSGTHWSCPDGMLRAFHCVPQNVLPEYVPRFLTRDTVYLGHVPVTLTPEIWDDDLFSPGYAFVNVYQDPVTQDIHPGRFTLPGNRAGADYIALRKPTRVACLRVNLREFTP